MGERFPDDIMTQIVMEYCHCGSIGSFLHNGNSLSESEIREIVSCCLLGLKYLHSTWKVIHRVVLQRSNHP